MNNISCNNYSENKNNFVCKNANFNQFQRDLMIFITNYIDNHNKKRFFDINVKNKHQLKKLIFYLEKLLYYYVRMF